MQQTLLTSLGSEFAARGEPEMVFLGAETRVAWRIRGVDRHGRDVAAVVTPGQAWLEDS